MNIAYFPNQMANGAEPIMKSFLEGCKKNGLIPIENSMTADMAVIWSVLWYGHKLMLNKQVYEHYRSQNKPVFIIEVGTINRGTTWKISANHINSSGLYGNNHGLCGSRVKLLELPRTEATKLSDSILIAGQHQYSLQWQGMPEIGIWVNMVVKKVRRYSDRPIIFRPHPRYKPSVSNVTVEYPIKILNTYDKYDINYNHWCVINHSSGPGIQAAIHNTAVITDVSSLAYPVSIDYSNIETRTVVDNYEWLIKIAHTEWLIDEIEQGIPINRVLTELFDYTSDCAILNEVNTTGLST